MTPIDCSERMPPIVHTDQERTSADVLFLVVGAGCDEPRWHFGRWDEAYNRWKDVATFVGDGLITYTPDQVTKWCELPPVEPVVSFAFGKTSEDASAQRLACSSGERCTLCGGRAAYKVEEDTFGEHRHPYTAYVCAEDFERIMFPFKHRAANESLRSLLSEAAYALRFDAPALSARIRSALEAAADTLPPSPDDEETQPFNEAPLRDDEVRPSTPPSGYEVVDEDGEEPAE